MGNPVLPVLADYARTILQNSIADPLARGSGLLSMIVSRWAGKEDPAGYGKAAEEEARSLYGYRPKYPETVDALGLMEKTAIGQLSKMPELIQQRTEQINPELGYGGRQIAELAPYFMGLYGGPKAKYFPKYGKFSNMADKMERFEISDKGAKFNLNNLKKVENGAMLRLYEVFEHPSLYKQYPHLKAISVEYRPDLTTSSFSEHAGNKYITIGRGGMNNKDTFLHEIQHAIQEKEGFARGGSPEGFSVNSVRAEIIQNDINVLERKIQRLEKIGDFDLAEKMIMNELRPLQSKLGEFLEMAANPQRSYRRLSGEIEARDAAARMSLSGQQRRKTAPYTSENIPLSEWITRRH